VVLQDGLDVQVPTLFAVLMRSGPNFIKPVSTKTCLAQHSFASHKQVISPNYLSLNRCGWCPTQFLLYEQLYEIRPFCFILKQEAQSGF
jgi:hypothetical protein